jgi:hypothetical protein
VSEQSIVLRTGVFKLLTREQKFLPRCRTFYPGAELSTQVQNFLPRRRTFYPGAELSTQARKPASAASLGKKKRSFKTVVSHQFAKTVGFQIMSQHILTITIRVVELLRL